MSRSPAAMRRQLRALARLGLEVEREGPYVRVRRRDAQMGAEVLLPESDSLDGKALAQLAAFAALAHPEAPEGVVRRAVATPDLHPGSLVPVGTVLATSDSWIVPQAIGTDIYCGMRLHVADLDVDSLLARRDEWFPTVRSDLLLGTRDLPLRVRQVRAMFRGGPLAWLESLRDDARGMLARSDLPQLEGELERSFGLGSADGDEALAPREMLPADRDEVRDCVLGTIGGGNHFVELQRVETVLDRGQAYAWGIREGQVAVMAHSGSRRVGVRVGSEWMARAREAWPEGVPHPADGLYALGGAAADRYFEAMSTAANYAAVNRLLLVELVRDRLRATFGRDLEMPLVYDAPHNIVTRERDAYVHRKGATPAFEGTPVLVPGSMGSASYLLVGCGSERFLRSASHGAGRRWSRRETHRRAAAGDDLGLGGVECVTLRDERVVQEAPAAYKDIDEVMQVQVDAGLARPVARLRPLMTFKG